MQAKDPDVGFQLSGIQPRQFDDGPEDVLHRSQCRFQVVGQAGRLGVRQFLRQRRGIEPGGVQGLQHVVPGGGDEAGLADIGFFGGGIGLCQRFVDACQLRRALRDPFFQRRLGAVEFRFRLNACGDVGKGECKPFVGQALRLELDDNPGFRMSMRRRFQLRHECLDAAIGDGLCIARPEHAGMGQVPEDVAQRGADLTEFGRQLEELPKPAVPEGQPQIGVEQGDALRHLIDRRLQETTVVVQRLGGVIEQMMRCPCRRVIAADQERQHQP